MRTGSGSAKTLLGVTLEMLSVTLCAQWPDAGIELLKLHPRRYRSSHQVSGGEWNELSKAPFASSLVLCVRVQLHFAPDGLSHGGTEPRTASESCSAGTGTC